jgi:hypothetical protein
MIFLNWFLAFWLSTSPAYWLTSSKYAGTAVDDSSIGTLTWTDPSNATGDGTDGNYASLIATASSEYTHYLKLTNYGFSIPAGATINGVQLQIRNAGIPTGTGFFAWNAIKLVNASGTIGTANKATGNLNSAPTTSTFGGSADTWAGEASAIDWNDADAGCAISVGTTPTITGDSYLYIYFVQIIITYTEAPAAGTSPRRTVIGQARSFSTKQQGVSF